MINTLKTCEQACAVAFGHRDTGKPQLRLLRKAPSQAPTRRHQIAVPFRLYGALLQRAAGRRGLAAMPAEEHVESFIKLPERGSRRGSAGGCNDGTSEIRRAKGCSSPRSRTADQRADFRHPQRMPLRLSEGSARACRPVARPALQCLEKNKAKLSAGCEEKPSPPPGGGGAPAAAPAAGRGFRPRRERLQRPPLHRRRRP